MSDPINPDHYRQGEIECIDAIRAALGYEGFLAYLRGQQLKYTWRAGMKGDAVQCLKKQRWYNEREIAERERGP